MAGIKRALRRRLLWTLVAAALGAVTLTGCGDKDQQPVDDDAVAGELTQLSTTWLAGFSASSSTNPGCLSIDFDVESTDPTGVTACLKHNGTGRSLQVRNQTGVPITVSRPGTILVWTAQPDATIDIPLSAWHDGETFTFKPNVVLGVMMVLQDQIKNARVPKVLQPLQCGTQGITDCLLCQAPQLLG
jgi:hypothetical protein